MKKIFAFFVISQASLLFSNPEIFYLLKYKVSKKTDEKPMILQAYFGPDLYTARNKLDAYCVQNGFEFINEIEHQNGDNAERLPSIDTVQVIAE